MEKRKYKFRLMICSMFIVFGMGQAYGDLTDGLIAHWTFEGGSSQVLDVSGNRNYGEVEDDATQGSASGKIGYAAEFVDSGDMISLGTIDIDDGGTAVDTMTITAWVKADSFLSGYSDNRIISKANVETGESDHYWMVSTIEQSGKVYLRFRLKTGGTTSTLIANDSGDDLSTGTWYHVAAVYDGARMRLYLDGVERESTAKTGDVDNGTSKKVAIGNHPETATDKHWDGLIDDVRIYNRALSTYELFVLATVVTPVDEPGLIGYWPLDESTASTAVEYTGSGFNGPVTGATVSTSGKIGNALSFDDDDDYVRPGAGFHDVDADEITLSAFIKINNVPWPIIP